MKLIVMGDLHYHQVNESIPEWMEARDDFYRTFLDKFMEMEADAHISLGDLTNYGHASELEEVYAIIRRHGRNFYHALGNHDLYAQTRREVLELTGQPRYHSITMDEAVLIFLDTAKEMDFEDWGGWLDGEQLEWFESVIQASGTKPVLVFAHHPVYRTTTNSDKDKGSIHPDIDLWPVLQQKQGVGVFFNGHTHVDSIVAQHNWTFVQLSACLDQQGLRVVDLEPNEIRISAIDLAEESLKKNAQLMYEHMKHFRHNPTARGTEEEREIVIPLRLTAEHR